MTPLLVPPLAPLFAGRPGRWLGRRLPRRLATHRTMLQLGNQRLSKKAASVGSCAPRWSRCDRGALRSGSLGMDSRPADPSAGKAPGASGRLQPAWSLRPVAQGTEQRVPKPQPSLTQRLADQRFVPGLICLGSATNRRVAGNLVVLVVRFVDVLP
jgi:hypothetical protein